MPAARWSPSRRCMRSRTATANTCSITAGRMPSSGPAATTTLSSRSRCRSARCRGRACCAIPTPACRPRCSARRWRRPAANSTFSCVHVTFCSEAEWRALGEAGWLQRLGMQFHWDNAGYASFDDFLGALTSRKRKTIRRERRDAQAAGLTFLALRGAEITERALGRLLSRSITRPSIANGAALISPEQFFPLLSKRLGDARGADAGARTTASRWPARSTSPAAIRSMAATGVADRRLAVSAFRALLLSRDRLRDRQRAEAGRGRARRASTKSSAAICRSPPIRPTGSRIPGCAAPWRISSTRSGPRIEAEMAALAELSPFRCGSQTNEE